MPAIDHFRHPVRMRIVHALSSGAELTTAELAAQLSDVPQASLYRHVQAMKVGGALEVVRTRPVRGATERTWRLVRGAAQVGRDEAAELSTEDLVDTVGTISAVLLTEFDQAVRARQPLNPRGTALIQLTLSLNADEAANFAEDLVALVAKYRDRSSEASHRHLLTTTLFATSHKPSP